VTVLCLTHELPAFLIPSRKDLETASARRLDDAFGSS
jgi:hypothetical protein